MEVGNLLGKKLNCQGDEAHFLDCPSDFTALTGLTFGQCLVDDQDQLLAPPFTLTEEFWLPYEDQNHAGSEIIGLTLVIFDPMNVVGDEALVKAKVTINDVILESRVWVEVQWGADAC